MEKWLMEKRKKETEKSTNSEETEIKGVYGMCGKCLLAIGIVFRQPMFSELGVFFFFFFCFPYLQCERNCEAKEMIDERH